MHATFTTTISPQAAAERQAREQIREQIREQTRQIREQNERIRQEMKRASQEAERAAQEAERAAEEAAARAEAPHVRMMQIPHPPPPPGQAETSVPPWQPPRAVPGEVVDIVGMLTFGTAAVLILRPLMRAVANRFERRGATPPALPAEVTAHMQRLEQAIEAVAIEVERISEGQRYTTKLLAEKAAKEV